jgi:Eukaryotic aspartyl protease
MMVIDKTWSLDGLAADGIMGMAPTVQREGAALMVNELYKQGAINESVFSFQVGTGDQSSHVTIGGYDTEAFALTNELTWHNLVNNFWWTLGLEGASVNGEDLGL